MTDSANVSIALYHYLCQNIVGQEEHVKTLRMMNNIRDNLQSNSSWTLITSGSFGEGLQMQESDLDIMVVLKLVEVFEDTHIYLNPKKTYFTMEMEDTQPGFTQLRLINIDDPDVFEHCVEIGNGFYFSNLSFKQRFCTNTIQTVHGPCVSDEDGLFDLAYCLHSRLWITPAKPWITRSNNSWPIYAVKQSIVKHGVLFVPIGVKGSTQEELEWRISFSVGEKLLIYSFTHTQLLCYALMKILLKDFIALDVNCKELLCSYFMKTILFWICEELPTSIWKPENLISCYMRCFRRLIYCVEYKVCPHYFIPENNLFENKIQGQAQEKLLEKLYTLNSYGWQCILLSNRISNLNAVASDLIEETSFSYAKGVERLLNSNIFHLDFILDTVDSILEKVIYKVLLNKSSRIKYLYIYYLSKSCCTSERFLPKDDISCNKSTYKESNTYISTLLLNTRHDAVSGWLKLSSFFYERKQYNKAVNIIQYSLFKWSSEKLHQLMQFSDIHYELFSLPVFRNMSFVQLRKFLLLGLVFIKHSKLQPIELQMDVPYVISPVVYAHFLCILCHYHLKNSRQCLNSLRNLQMTIEKNHFIDHPVFKRTSYYILYISCQLLGDKESARQALKHCRELTQDQQTNAPFKTLLLINSI